LCLGAFVAILSGLSGLGLNKGGNRKRMRDHSMVAMTT